MSDYRTTTTPSYTNVTTERSGSGALWFIVGGLLVAVAVIAWLLAGDDLLAPSASAPEGSNLSVTVEDNSSPSSTTIEAPAPAEEPAPEAAPAEPVTPAPAPSGN